MPACDGNPTISVVRRRDIEAASRLAISASSKLSYAGSVKLLCGDQTNMSEYVSESTTESRSLASDESLEIEFRPKNPGPVTITASASWDRLIPPDPTKRRLVLMAPDRDEPVATSENRGIFLGSRLEFSVSEEDLTSPGQWRARIVNLERMEDTEEFELSVSYPTDTKVLTVEVDAFDIERQLHELFKPSAITLTSGPDESVVRLRPEMSVEDYRFTVPDLDEEILVGDNRHTLQMRLHELTAQPARVSLVESGLIHFSYEFDRANYTFVGEPPVQIHRPQIQIFVPLGTTEDGVVASGANASFDFEFSLERAQSAQVEWEVEDYVEELRNHVGKELASAFDRERVHEYIEDTLSPVVDKAVPDDARLYGVGRVVQGTLEVKYVAE